MSNLTDNYPSVERIWLCAWTTLGSGLTEDTDFGKKKIIFSDEAHFDLRGYINKQNCRIWSTKSSHAYIEKPTHPKWVFVLCGFWSRGIIGPFFFENEQGEAITVNGDRYRAMLNEFLFHKNWREGYWQHLVSTRQRYVPHSLSYTRCFAPRFWRAHYQPQSWCRLATSELRFDTVGLLFVRCRHG